MQDIRCQKRVCLTLTSNILHRTSYIHVRPAMNVESRAAPITDSPWFWVLAFSLMALLALVAIGGKYGRRQTRLELQYQARERIADRASTANNSAAAARRDDPPRRREFATPGDNLIPLWPLAAILSWSRSSRR